MKAPEPVKAPKSNGDSEKIANLEAKIVKLERNIGLALGHIGISAE